MYEKEAPEPRLIYIPVKCRAPRFMAAPGSRCAENGRKTTVKGKDIRNVKSPAYRIDIKDIIWKKEKVRRS